MRRRSRPARGPSSRSKPPPNASRSRGPLGTTAYPATEKEKPFLQRTPAAERAIGSILDNQAGYDLATHRGKPVSWFGIVREVRRLDDGRFELLLDHKYFDGLTDVHILALSFNGAGDFKAVLGGGDLKGVKDAKDLPLKPLMLLRVYGTVADDQPAGGDKDAPPVVVADYVRAFPWKTFTFIDAYGKDQTNPKWRKLNKVPLDDIYNPYPTDNYYRQRLGEVRRRKRVTPLKSTIENEDRSGTG